MRLKDEDFFITKDVLFTKEKLRRSIKALTFFGSTNEAPNFITSKENKELSPSYLLDSLKV